MLTLKEVAAALQESTRRPRGWLLLGAPHAGEGRYATFDGPELTRWCEEGAEAAARLGDVAAEATWRGYADRIRTATTAA